MDDKKYITQLERDNETLREKLKEKQSLEDLDRFIKYLNKNKGTRVSKEALQDMKHIHNINIMKQIVELSFFKKKVYSPRI